MMDFDDLRLLHPSGIASVKMKQDLSNLFDDEDHWFSVEEYLLPFSQAYSKSFVSVLTKCLLQLGVIVIFSFNTESSILLNEVAPLSHPFSYRREFFAPTEIKKFIISIDDMNILRSKSELEEEKEDVVWKSYILDRPTSRALTNAVTKQSK
jgi:hypothetical protein